MAFFNIPEYNQFGDTRNGVIGSQQPGALVNQTTQTSTQQSKSGGQSPFESMLQHAISGQQPLTASTSMAGALDRQPEPIFDPSMPQPPIQPPTDPGEWSRLPRYWEEPVGGGAPIQPPTDPRFPVNQPADPAGGGRTRSVATTPSAPVLPPVDPGEPPMTPPTTGDYYTDKAYEYSQYEGPWKGQVTREDVLAYHQYAQQAAAKGTTNLQFADWWNKGKPAQFFDPYDGGQYQTPGGQPPGPGGPPTGGQPPAGGAPPPGPGGQPPAGTHPAGGLGGPPTLTPFDPNGVQIPDIASQLQKYFDPSNKSAQSDLARQLQHNASVTGAINSGGFGATFGKSMGDLIGKQQAQIGEMAFQGQQAALNRALQWATYANDFERNNWVDQNKFALERAGIDTERYKADMGYRAAMESASAQAAASMYGDDRRYQLGLVGNDVDRERNLLNNQLQWSQLGMDWAKFLYSVSPDAFLQGLTPFGGNTFVRP